MLPKYNPIRPTSGKDASCPGSAPHRLNLEIRVRIGNVEAAPAVAREAEWDIGQRTTLVIIDKFKASAANARIVSKKCPARPTISVPPQ